jgi:hypothetical protein
MLHIYISVVMEDAIDILGSDKFLVSKDSNHYQKYWTIEDVSALVKEEYQTLGIGKINASVHNQYK